MTGIHAQDRLKCASRSHSKSAPYLLSTVSPLIWWNLAIVVVVVIVVVIVVRVVIVAVIVVIVAKVVVSRVAYILDEFQESSTNH